MISDPTPERRWSLYYLVQTAISVVVVAVGAIFFSASISVLAGILLAGYAALAIVHSVGEYYPESKCSQNTEKTQKTNDPE
jgi:zinc transporter ZupT